MNPANPSPVPLPPPRDYAPYRPGEFRVAMDLRKLEPAEWIEIDTHLPAELAEKRRLLAHRRAEVFAVRPQAAAGSRETLAMLADHLAAHFPQVYRRRGDCLHNLATGERWNLAGAELHPLELAGRLVQEDFVLMQRAPDETEYRLVGACVCFPSRWRLAEKMGHPLNFIHRPVPTYQQQISAAMTRLFDRLSPRKPVWRVNWSVVDDPQLFQPEVRPRPDNAPPITAQNAGNRLWLRMERQTLRRLPASGDIVFTIRIYSRPLSSLAVQPERATQLAAALRGLSPDMLAYKAMPALADAAIGWLEAVSG